MNLQTNVELPNLPFTINHQDKIVMLGSCFSTEIGRWFQKVGYQTLINPFGTVYNPASIAFQLDVLTEFNSDELSIIERKGKFIFFDGNTEFVEDTKEALIAKIKHQADVFCQFVKDTKVCFITLGSAKVYQHESNEQIVANCHKLPAAEFTESFLSPELVESFLVVSYDSIKRIHPEIEIVFTVSPVRYLADGLVNSTRSKAALHIGIANALQECEDAYYFPSYEIVIDELRDYRFYRDDYAHVNQLGVDYVWKKVEDTFLNTKDEQIRKQVLSYRKLQQHRVVGGEEAKQTHQALLHKKLLKLIELYPHLEFLKTED